MIAAHSMAEPTCNGVMAGAIGLGVASGSFRDIEWNRQCSSAKLFRQRRMAFGQILRQLRRACEELDGTSIDVELLEAEHDVPVGHFEDCGCVSSSPSPSPSTTTSTSTTTTTTTTVRAGASPTGRTPSR